MEKIPEKIIKAAKLKIIISATGDSNAQSKLRKGKIVHGMNNIMVEIAVKILFFIGFISFQMRRIECRTQQVQVL